MHEVDMTRCLLLSMNEWKDQRGPATPVVQRVHLQVGTFTCVEPDQLVTTWQVAVQGSWLEGAELAIETVPLVGRCLICNATYSPDPQQAYRSPCCRQPLEEIVSGRELRIRSVEYLAGDQPQTGDQPARSQATAPASRQASSSALPSRSPATAL